MAWLCPLLWSAPATLLFDGAFGSASSAGVLTRILNDSLAARGSVVSPDTLLKLRERGDCTADRSEAAIAKCLQKSKLARLVWVEVGPVQGEYSRFKWFPLWGRRTWSLAGNATVAGADSRKTTRFSATYIQSLGFVGTAPADRFPASSAEIGKAADSLGILVSKDLARFLFADSSSGGTAPISP